MPFQLCVETGMQLECSSTESDDLGAVMRQPGAIEVVRSARSTLQTI
jgi:hypothetical protein